jgi:hypothetical protein
MVETSGIRCLKLSFIGYLIDGALLNTGCWGVPAFAEATDGSHLLEIAEVKKNGPNGPSREYAVGSPRVMERGAGVEHPT